MYVPMTCPAGAVTEESALVPGNTGLSGAAGRRIVLGTCRAATTVDNRDSSLEVALGEPLAAWKQHASARGNDDRRVVCVVCVLASCKSKCPTWTHPIFQGSGKAPAVEQTLPPPRKSSQSSSRPHLQGCHAKAPGHGLGGRYEETLTDTGTAHTPTQQLTPAVPDSKPQIAGAASNNPAIPDCRFLVDPLTTSASFFPSSLIPSNKTRRPRRRIAALPLALLGSARLDSASGSQHLQPSRFTRNCVRPLLPLGLLLVRACHLASLSLSLLFAGHIANLY